MLSATAAEESAKTILQTDGDWQAVQWFDSGSYVGDTHAGALPYDWSAPIQTWSWDVTDASGLATIIAEWAGYDEINAFGWYDAQKYSSGSYTFDYSDTNNDGVIDDYGTALHWSGSGWTSTLSDPNYGVIFLGSDAEGTSHSISNTDMGTSTTQFGFWMDPVSEPEGVWYSEHMYNSDGEVHQRVFKQTDTDYITGSYDSVWGLFWEDLAGEDSSQWDWDFVHPTEPDYNDLVVEMDMSGASGAPPTPELPASVLVLLGAVPLGLGYLRHRRRTDE